MKKKIVFMSDGPWTPSGFGTVIKNLMNNLKDDYEIAILSWQHVGCRQKFDNITYYPSGVHQFGKDVLAYVIKDFKPDYLITLGDYWMCGYIADEKMKSLLKENNTEWIWYIPIDSDVVPFQYVNLLGAADELVTMSQHGYDTVKRYGYTSTYIPHGTNTSVYKPMDKTECRKKWKYDDDKFIIGCVARNQDRKQLPRLLKAFSTFQKGKPEVLLHLHCDPLDPMNLAKDADNKVYSTLIQAMYTYGIEVKVNFTTNLQAIGYINGITDIEMAELYNIMDIHALPTSGEGFGLPILDSLACGIPNVMTDYTTATEFLGNNERGIKVPVIASLWGGFGTERAIVNEEEFAKGLQYLYDNKVIMKNMSDSAITFVKEYNWKLIVQKWKNLLV